MVLELQISGGPGDLEWLMALRYPTLHRATFTVRFRDRPLPPLPIQLVWLRRLGLVTTSWRFEGIVYDEDNEDWGDHHHRVVGGTYNLGKNTGTIRLYGKLVIRVIRRNFLCNDDKPEWRFASFCVPHPDWKVDYCKTATEAIDNLLSHFLGPVGLSTNPADYEIRNAWLADETTPPK